MIAHANTLEQPETPLPSLSKCSDSNGRATEGNADVLTQQVRTRSPSTVKTHSRI